MTASLPTHSPAPLASLTRRRGHGTLHQRTDEVLRLMGVDTAAQSGTEGSSPLPAASELELSGGARALLTWTGPSGGISDELALQGLCGLMAVHGRRSGAPHVLPYDYATCVSVTAHITGLFAAELARLRSGTPVTVSTRADACALTALSQYLAAATADDAEAVPVGPGTATFTTSDGVDFEIESLGTQPWSDFWRALGAPPPAVARGWAAFQFRYATACAPLPSDLAVTAASAGWERVRGAAKESGVGLVPLDTRAEPSPSTGGLWTLDPLAPGDRENVAPTPPGMPLQGLTVLEAGRRIQAPLASHLLRSLGATVVRVEPPGGDPLRGMPPMSGAVSARWFALNHGKDAVQVDIKTPAGRCELRELVRGADVFLHNWAPGKAEQLELCADSLAAVNPSLVYAYTSGWGGPAEGLPPGTDFMVQSQTGLTSRAPGGRGRTVASLMTVLDVLGGFLGAQAVTAALARRQVAGGGVAVESSLRGASRLLRSARRPDAEALVRTERGWATAGDAGRPVPVTEHLADLEHEPALTGLLSRPEQGCLTVRSPWEVA